MNQLNNSPLLYPYGLVNNEGPRLKFIRGDGIYLYDENGNRYINASSGLWNLSLGTGNLNIERAIENQLYTLPFSSLFHFTHEPALRLADKLINISNSYFKKVYLTCSGSEGIDFAIKLVILYQIVKNSPNRNKILSFDLSYHGTTYAALSASGIERQRSLQMLPPLSGFGYIPFPYCFQCEFNKKSDECEFQCIEILEKTLKDDEVAALLIEPILASAGNVAPPQGYFEEVNRVCQQNEVLIIVDEVATGLGRCGSMFAWEMFGLNPDIVVVSKGLNAGYLPIGAVMVGNDVDSALKKGETFIPHGSSQDGNPISCSAAIAALEYLEENRIVDHVKEVGAQLLQALREAIGEYPMVGDIRGVGLMISVELTNGKTKEPVEPHQINQILLDFIQRGLLVYPFRRGFSLFPPLNITLKEALSLVPIIEEVITENKEGVHTYV